MSTSRKLARSARTFREPLHLHQAVPSAWIALDLLSLRAAAMTLQSPVLAEEQGTR